MKNKLYWVLFDEIIRNSPLCHWATRWQLYCTIGDLLLCLCNRAESMKWCWNRLYSDALSYSCYMCLYVIAVFLLFLLHNLCLLFTSMTHNGFLNTGVVHKCYVASLLLYLSYVWISVSSSVFPFLLCGWKYTCGFLISNVACTSNSSMWLILFCSSYLYT